MTSKSQYSDLTLQLTKSLTKQNKQSNGIYFTPQNIIHKFVGKIIYASGGKMDFHNILEPSCGTCEFVSYLDNVIPVAKIKATTKANANAKIHIDCIENNLEIYEQIKNIKFKHDVKIIHQNFLSYQSEKKYDLIIGNPPFVVCSKNAIPPQYQKYMIGRPNLFGVFILHSLSMLVDNGILAFIVPNSFLNSHYYSAIRNHIMDVAIILDIVVFDDSSEKFIETKQTIFGLILEMKNKEINKTINDKFALKINNNYVFTTDAKMLGNIFENSQTLADIGLKVRTGSIIWNEYKDKMSNNVEKTLLIYNYNITKNNAIEIREFKNVAKKQYINLPGIQDIVLVVNRGNGNSKYKLNYAIVDIDHPYLVENHLNVIYFENGGGKSRAVKRAIFQKIIKSFENPKTQLFIDMFLGNNGLSKTELQTIFPIYII